MKAKEVGTGPPSPSPFVAMSTAPHSDPSNQPWILVLDPAEAVRETCASAAASCGHECRFAENVPEALAMVYSSKPAAIIASFGMPIMPGSSLVAALGASRAHRAIPIGAVVASENGRESFAAYEPAGYIDRMGDMKADVASFLEGIGLTSIQAASESPVPVRSQPRVPLAEDSPTNQLIIARLLHTGGADVTVVSDGIEALSALGSNDYDMVHMDIEMPNMDGMECAEKMREAGYELPIIAVTGHEEENISSEEVDENFDGFLQKPVDKSDIRNLLTRYRRRRLAA